MKDRQAKRTVLPKPQNLVHLKEELIQPFVRLSGNFEHHAVTLQNNTHAPSTLAAIGLNQKQTPSAVDAFNN